MSEKFFIENGSEYIQKLISDAVDKSIRSVTVTGNYIVDKAIRIPSDFTVILKDCHLIQAEGCFDNVFVNEQSGTEKGKTPEGCDSNIKIIGEGVAIIDGGVYNGLSEKTQRKNGMPPIWKNNLILFSSVQGFEIRNISCHNQRWWAINLLFCSDGYISNIDFRANDIWIDENGDQYHGLDRSKYDPILVKNADGIDLRQGCHHITIENITGFTEDDTIALTALDGSLERQFKVEGVCCDICHVTIKNVASASFCTNVRLLNQGDIKLHDIIIENITDTSESSPYMDRGLYTVRVGDADRMYGTRFSTAEETYNISIKNVYSRAVGAALHLAGDIGNLYFENINCEEGTPMLQDYRTKKE